METSVYWEKIFKEYLEKEALNLISQSNRVDNNAREKANDFSTLYINEHHISAKLALKEMKISKTTSLALRLDAPNAETVIAFKWTENYIKSGKRKGVKAAKNLFK